MLWYIEKYILQKTTCCADLINSFFPKFCVNLIFQSGITHNIHSIHHDISYYYYVCHYSSHIHILLENHFSISNFFSYLTDYFSPESLLHTYLHKPYTCSSYIFFFNFPHEKSNATFKLLVQVKPKTFTHKNKLWISFFEKGIIFFLRNQLNIFRSSIMINHNESKWIVQIQWNRKYG